jgi:CheY-like chemotaxis protein
VLWVDDRPANNTFERQALEAVGVRFTLALTTDEALEKAAAHRFAAIISDMGRPEGSRAGYDLLERLRAAGDRTPVFLYSSSGSLERQREAKQRGAQGATSKAPELFQMVIGVIGEGRRP